MKVLVGTVLLLASTAAWADLADPSRKTAKLAGGDARKLFELLGKRSRDVNGERIFQSEDGAVVIACRSENACVVTVADVEDKE